MTLGAGRGGGETPLVAFPETYRQSDSQLRQGLDHTYPIAHLDQRFDWLETVAHYVLIPLHPSALEEQHYGTSAEREISVFVTPLSKTSQLALHKAMHTRGGVLIDLLPRSGGEHNATDLNTGSTFP